MASHSVDDKREGEVGGKPLGVTAFGEPVEVAAQHVGELRLGQAEKLGGFGLLFASHHCPYRFSFSGLINLSSLASSAFAMRVS